MNTTSRTAAWGGRRVLLTGHTGFKGSWLSLWLQMLGAKVTGFSNGIPTEPSLFRAARVHEDMESITGDVADLPAVEAALQSTQPEVVFHLAAQALVRQSYSSPLETYRTNVIGTANVLEALRCSGIPCVLINVTSDKCYENRGAGPAYRETDPLGGSDPYSSSKACAELVAQAYRKSFFIQPGGVPIRVASVRAGNVIGGGDWARDRLIPDVIRAVSAGHEVVIRHPEAIRPWQHVLAATDGYLLLAERLAADPSFGGAWNFGPPETDGRSVKWILDRLAELWPTALSWRYEPDDTVAEASYLQLDSTLARTRLGWKPWWDLARSLQETLRWYQAWMADQDMKAVCLEQINAYSVARDVQ